jgi:uncharacterized protein YndB with AHSA1/START domain
MYTIGSLDIEVIDTRIVVRRTFAAPRSAVFDALTAPALLACWVAPAAWALEVCDSDPRRGGAYRFAARGPCGAIVRWRGRYTAIAAGEHIVQTRSYEEWAAGESIVATTLSDEHGQTTLSSSLAYASPRARDAVLNSLILRVAADGYDNLAALLGGDARNCRATATAVAAARGAAGG